MQRYYASYCKDNKHITSWIDIDKLSTTDHLNISDLFPLTDEQWNNRKLSGMGIVNDKLVDGVASPVDLTHEANCELRFAREYVQNHFILLGETPAKEWIDYQKELMAVIGGSKGALKKLPTRPNV